MPVYGLPRLSSPEVLRKIAPERFTAFLALFRPNLSSRGVNPVGEGELPDYEKLVQVFMTPDSAGEELVDALSRIDELATPEGMDGLLNEADRRAIDLGLHGESCSADVALTCWLNEREVFDRVHAGQQITRFRSSEFYRRNSSDSQRCRLPNARQLKEMEESIDDRNEHRKRGRGCRIFMFQPQQVRLYWLSVNRSVDRNPL